MGTNYSPHVVSIHILDDDSLLNIFYLYRPFFLGEYEEGIKRLHGGLGSGNEVAGGTASHMFAEDGETLYLVRHPTCVFRSSVQMARPFKTYSHIHLPFRSLLITAVTMVLLQKTKRGYCSLSSCVIAFATSAFSSLPRICGSLSWQLIRNSRSWNT